MRLQAKATRAASQLMSLNLLMWLSMLLLFSGIMFLAAAAYLAMAMVLAPALAALFTGLGLLVVFLLLAAVIFLALRAANRPAPRAPAQPAASPAEPPRGGDAIDHNLRPIIGARATDWTRDNTGIAITGALAAGVLLAASPGLRRFVVRSAGPIVTRKLINAVQDFTAH